jgi:predicted aldo/keto reductase-like oxidoreductase
MDCSFGVDIPGIFEIYNDYKKSENKDIASRSYFLFTAEEARADKCQKCGECTLKCPQQINIPEELEKIHQEMLKLK